jgi:hypothetical protein
MATKIESGAAKRVVPGWEDAGGDWRGWAHHLGVQQVALAGSAGGDLGTVAIDQTIPGTTNKVVADVATATPTVYNVTCTLANTEYSQALPANCRMFEFQARTDVDIRFAFVTGKVATPTAPYMSLKAADYYWSPAINQGASLSTLYVGSSTAGTVVEIIAWV